MGMFEKLFGRQRRVTEDNATVELPIPRGPALQVGNVQGVGARERQEDSFAVLNASNAQELERRGLFAVVCDGMGGMEDGKESSEAAVEAFLQLFQSLLDEGDVPQQLREGTLAPLDVEGFPLMREFNLVMPQGMEPEAGCLAFHNFCQEFLTGDESGKNRKE